MYDAPRYLSLSRRNTSFSLGFDFPLDYFTKSLAVFFFSAFQRQLLLFFFFISVCVCLCVLDFHHSRFPPVPLTTLPSLSKATTTFTLVSSLSLPPSLLHYYQKRNTASFVWKKKNCLNKERSDLQISLSFYFFSLSFSFPHW